MRTHLFAAALLLAAGSAAAQAPTSGDESFRVDVAVPEAPAFLLSGGDANALLRPSTVRDLSAAFGDFTDEDGRFMLPASFAVEIAPSLLFFGRGQTADQYAATPLWSTLRVSLGTHRADGNDQATKVAIGFRTSPINGADPRMNWEYRQSMRSLLAARNVLNHRIALATCGITENTLVPPDVNAPEPANPPVASPEAAARVADCLTNPPANRPAAAQALVADRDAAHAAIVAQRKAFAEQNWNQQTLEFAGAFSMVAADSTGRSPRPAEYAAWGTYTHPLASWAQGMLGARFRSARDTITDERGNEWLVGGRLYMGRNTAKALIEAQMPFGDDLELRPYAGLGAEVRILPELWATFSAGIERKDDDDASRLVTRFSIRSGKPNIQPPSPTLSQRTP